MADQTFFHLSDPHITVAGERLNGVDTAASLERVIARAGAIGLAPSFVLVTGDLTMSGDPAEYERARRLLAPLAALGAPLLLALGNHDVRAAYRAVWGLAGGAEPYRHRADLAGLRLLVLDSSLPDRVDGRAGAAQIDWLAGQLDEPFDGQTLVAIHHPPLFPTVPDRADLVLADADAFLEVVDRHRVLGVLSGHTHVATTTTRGQTCFAVAPSTAFGFDWWAASAGAVVPAAGFNVCFVRDGRLTVHTEIAAVG